MNATQKRYAPLVGATLLVFVVAALSFWSLRQSEAAAEARNHVYEVISRAHALLAELTDAETGQRGYALTGDESFLNLYLAVRESFRGHLEELRLLTLNSAASDRLDALAPLVDAKLAHMSRVIEMRRRRDATAAQAAVASGDGRQLMDSIRAEMRSFLQIAEGALAQRDATLRSNSRNLFAIIVTATFLMLAFALAFAYLIFRETQHRLRNVMHVEARQLLEAQEETNRQLQQANTTLQISEEKLAVTLSSIGDGVIATDARGRVTLLNPVAERLTGWTLAEASGRPVDEIFHIISQKTRQPSTIPVTETLAHGTVHGLANHTILIARDGSECPIADSCAPIRDRDDAVVGAVLIFRDVTEEDAARLALRDSAALIQTILDTVADGIITIHASGGIVERANSAAERMFGYSAAELIGQNFGLLIPELARDQHDGSLEYYSATDEARAAGRGREVTGRRRDGSIFPLEIAASEMSLGGTRYFTGILRDITARKRVEAALQKAGALENAILTSANFSIIATDAKGVIQLFNVGAERMLGYMAAEVVNKLNPSDIHDPREVLARAEALSLELATPIKPGFEALAFKASRGIADIYELTYIRKNGSCFPAIVSITALRDDNGGIIGYLLIGTDNSVRKQVELDLKTAIAVAEKANLAKSDFLSSMSHELRTPLSAILGFAQLMESGSPAPTVSQKRSIDQILKAGWYLLDLINEILDLALIESGKLSLSMEPMSLAEVMRECQTMIEPQAQKRGISLAFPRFAIPYFVQADRTRVKQILINLLSNAIKYNTTGGSVGVDCFAGTAKRVRITVKDTGAGLSAEKLAQLFQPFNRLGQEVNVEEGTGIGLVVCKRLVELMGGVIGMESTVGKGSVFWIELNLTAEPQRAAGAAEPALAQGQGHADAQSRTLLYIEDNPANLMLLEDLIARRPDIHMSSARDGISGIEMALASKPDVILMDINLPGISGIEALRILAEDPLTAHIPVIALSANAMPRDIEKGLEAGFFRYLTKPIKVTEFMKTLDLALQFAETQAARDTLEEKA